MTSTLLKVVYYYDESLKCCPVKKYLERFLISNKDSQEVKNRKIKLLIDIDNKIQIILENDGRPIPPISKPLKEYGVIEILHRKDKNILIRIIYFRCNNLMVLLLGFDKPDNYSSMKTKREVEKYYKIAENYKKLFVLNNKLYEDYNQ